MSGKNYTLGPVDFTIPRYETQSYWTFDNSTGINIDVILLVNCIISWSILISSETDLLKKGWIKLTVKLYGNQVSRSAHIDGVIDKEIIKRGPEGPQHNGCETENLSGAEDKVVLMTQPMLTNNSRTERAPQSLCV